MKTTIEVAKGYRPKNTSAYIGYEMTVRGSSFKIVSFDSRLGQSSPRFWCEALDNNDKYFKKGERFPLSKDTVYRYAKIYGVKNGKVQETSTNNRRPARRSTDTTQEAH